MEVDIIDYTPGFRLGHHGTHLRGVARRAGRGDRGGCGFRVVHLVQDGGHRETVGANGGGGGGWVWQGSARGTESWSKMRE